ncbi:MAG: FeoC-like transcriptional regulator [Gammaproteobacteria bacterium]|nr:FeoC-like transcriptional regulator [Gammaproteobacteria bacterium]
MLSSLKSYLREHGAANLQEIARHLDATEEAVEGMLRTLILKGGVEQVKIKAACGSSCANCEASATHYYRLPERKPKNTDEHPISAPPGCRW